MRILPLAIATLAVLLAGPARAAPPPIYVALGDSTAVGVGAERGGGYPERLGPDGRPRRRGPAPRRGP